VECPSCRADVPSGKRYCIKCGAAMPLTCSGCGNANAPGARFCGDCGKPITGTELFTERVWPPTEGVGQPAPSAERRQLTVMFVDLVGSTALSAQLDPEDLREIFHKYHGCCASEINKAGGFVAKYIGDGVLAYFGYPQAHEDDSQRAVRAGLAVIDAVGKLAAPQRLQVRIGIATGVVVVGDLLGAGSAREQTVVGETPNLAARLQALAEPDACVIAESTRRQIGSLFQLRDLGPQQLKGFAEPQHAWSVVSENRALGRFEALRSAATPLVGREEELELLLRRWRQAASGEGRVVLLAGEPGIGKSRLVMELEECLGAEPHATFRYFSSPNDADSAFHPIIMQLERAAGLQRHDAASVNLDRLRAVLQPSPGRETDIQLIADLLSIRTADCFAPLTMSPKAKRHKTFEALTWQLEGLSRQQPLLVIYEDVHWLDPSSRELLDMSVERVARLPVLLVITFRSPFQPPWAGQPHVTALALNRLARREGAALVESLSGHDSLSAKIAEEIVERADGIPLFVEELTKVILETGIELDDSRKPLLIAPLSGLTVPATLHASLMARLDRLGPGAREVAQIGAAIGREFSYEILAPVVGRGGEQLQAALDALSEAGLVYCRGTPPRATFLFKHALVRDAAYGSLLRKTRQELHVRIAKVLEDSFPETTEMQPEVIAHHYSQGGCAEDAVAWWRAAGHRASRLSHNAEAAAHLSKALELIAASNGGRDRDLLELNTRIDLGGPLIGSKGWSAPELEENYARAWALCERTGATEQVFPVLWGQYVAAGYRAAGGLTLSEEKARRFLQLAKQERDTGLEVVGHRMLGVQLVSRGDFARGRQHLEQAIALYDPEHHQSLAFAYSLNPRVSALVTLGLTLQYLGFPDQASRAGDQGVEEAQQSGHFNTLGVALHLTGRLHAFRRDGAQLRRLASQLITLTNEQGSTDWRLAGEILLAWQEARDGALKQGLEAIRRGVDGLRARKLNVWLPHYLLMQAEICSKAGRFDEAMQLLDETMELMELQDHPVCEAELHRLRACTELSRGASASVVEACFDRAFDVARRQCAKFWELRTAISRARFWRDKGRRAEAGALLLPIYDWFTEGFDTPDLREAKALLDELAV
jgi:class 3 adenylate cyclase/predicted ATPase